MAGLFAALWFGGIALLFRIAPPPEAPPRQDPLPLSWWPAQDGNALDLRAIWTPSAFALASPAGFSHSLRGERVGLAPPVQTARPPAAFLDDRRPAAAFDFSKPGRTWTAPAPDGALPEPSVFPPRARDPAQPRLVFPEGWESRQFSGIDLNFGGWTNGAWSARVEMRFDAKGVPVSMLLAQSSGTAEVDRRLARSATGWRLLEPAAPRTGVVEWNSPAPPPAAAAEEVAP